MASIAADAQWQLVRPLDATAEPLVLVDGPPILLQHAVDPEAELVLRGTVLCAADMPRRCFVDTFATVRVLVAGATAAQLTCCVERI